MGLLNQTQRGYYDSSNSLNYGDYQFVSLDHIINGFMVAYVGESKLIPKVNRTDVQFHGMRAIQEFSYDIFRSVKSQEIEVPNTLKMILPQDYVNYSKITRVDSDGVERTLYPTGKTSNPFAIQQDTSGAYQFDTRRTITITLPSSGSGITDGDHINLPFLNSNGSIETMSLVFSEDADFLDSAVPTPGDDRIRFGVRTHADTSGNPAFGSSIIADRIVKVLNDTNRFEAVKTNNTTVTVVYKESLSSYAGESTREADGSSQSRTPIAVVASGSGNISYQAESDTWAKYKAGSTSPDTAENYDNEEHTFDYAGRRYGLDPQHAQGNGTFYIDYERGFIHFGSSLTGETVVLHYISDGLGTDSEMVVHKFAEEAVYKWIAYGIISSRTNMPEYIVQRFKKERFAEARKAKIRLSNIKIEEFTQVLKGLGKTLK